MRNINDKTLLETTKQLVSKERKLLSEILDHLQEIYDRRLFADLGYSSLFKYLVKELKYSEGAAARRISALRLVKKVPEAKKLIVKGELNLTVAAKAQSFTQRQTKEETKEVLKLVVGKTSDEAQKVLFAMTAGNTAVVAEKIVRVSENEVRMHLTISDKTRKKIKKQVMIRAKSCCEYPECDETRNLQFEHLIPFAHGGRHTEKNLKLFCRSHNQRAAIKIFGRDHMGKFLS